MKKRKRVLIVLGFGELGGAERQAIYLAEGLKNSGHRVSVLNFGPPGRANRMLDQSGIPNSSIVIRIGGKRKHLRRDLRKLYFRIIRARPHVVIPYTRHPNVYCNALGPFMPFTRVAWNQRDEGRELTREPVEEYAIRKARWIISNSTPGKQALIEKYALNPGRVILIRNGVAPVEENAASKHASGSLVHIGMIANLHGSKDHSTLIKGWHLFKQRHPAHRFQLLIAGRDDGLLSALRKQAEELGVAGSVTFLGQVTAIHDFIRRLHIGVHSSLNEGCPNAILEMMSHGLPVIANAIPGNMDALGTGYPLYFQTGNSQELADKLGLLIGNESLAASLGEQNRRRARNGFSIQRMISNYQKLLHL